jgi:hypothetical protein
VLIPSAEMDERQTTTIKATMSAYSMAVGPSSLRRKFQMRFMGENLQVKARDPAGFQKVPAATATRAYFEKT